MTGQATPAKKAAAPPPPPPPASGARPADESLDEQIERAGKENDLLRLQVEQRKLRAVLDDLDRKAMPTRKEL